MLSAAAYTASRKGLCSDSLKDLTGTMRVREAADFLQLSPYAKTLNQKYLFIQAFHTTNSVYGRIL
jgi:hypothetical protein